MQIVFLSTTRTMTTTTVALDFVSNVCSCGCTTKWNDSHRKNFDDREFGWSKMCTENRRNELEAISFSLCFYSSQWLRIRNKKNAVPPSFFALSLRSLSIHSPRKCSIVSILGFVFVFCCYHGVAGCIQWTVDGGSERERESVGR